MRRLRSFLRPVLRIDPSARFLGADEENSILFQLCTTDEIESSLKLFPKPFLCVPSWNRWRMWAVEPQRHEFDQQIVAAIVRQLIQNPFKPKTMRQHQMVG